MNNNVPPCLHACENKQLSIKSSNEIKWEHVLYSLLSELEVSRFLVYFSHKKS